MTEKESAFEKISSVITIAANAVTMNALFLLACLPIVTIGAAWNGLFSAIRYNVRGEKWFEGFKYGFKNRFLRGTVAWLIMLVFTAIAILDFSLVLSAMNVARLIASSLMLLLVFALNGSLILLNVYIPTNVGNWVRNAVNMVFYAPLQIFITGLLMWLPIMMAIFFPQYFWYLIMVFVVAYYILASLGITMLMKKPLIHYLVQAREQGTLLVEEGKQRQTEKESQEGVEHHE